MENNITYIVYSYGEVFGYFNSHAKAVKAISDLAAQTKDENAILVIDCYNPTTDHLVSEDYEVAVSEDGTYYPQLISVN